MLRVTVLAATGQVGRALVRRLLTEGASVVAVGRDPAKLSALPAGVETRIADLTDPLALQNALADAELVACCANAAHVPAVLAALPVGVQRLAAMGSTRMFSAVPDATATAVRAAVEALRTAAVPSVMLLATMIYGGGHGVAESLARLARTLPVLPTPSGHGARVQPIHVDDLAACLAAALQAPDACGAPIVIAGSEPLSYAELVRRIVKALDIRCLVVPVPAGLAGVAGRLLTVLGRSGAGAALRRLAEDRSFDLADMRERLGIEPRPFQPARMA